VYFTCDYELAAPLVCAKIGMAVPPLGAVIAVFDETGIRAGTVFELWSPEATAMFGHMYVEEGYSLPRKFLWMLGDYVFNQLRMESVYGLVDSRNERAVEFNYKLGYELEATLKGFYRDGDLLAFQLKPERYKWLALGSRYGKEVCKAT
jgi:hypothetical protein